MPIDIDGQTIWVECVESQKGSGDAIMMEVGDTEGIFLFCLITFFLFLNCKFNRKNCYKQKTFSAQNIVLLLNVFFFGEFCRILSQFHWLKGLILS